MSSLTVKSKNNKSLYDKLDPVFTKEEVIANATILNICTPARKIISRWNAEGIITKVDKNKWRKKK